MKHGFFARLVKPLLLACIILLTVWMPADAQRRSSRGMNSDGDFVGGSGSSGGGGGGGSFGGGGDWSVALNIGYDVPHGDIKYTYKAAPTVGLSLQKKVRSFTISGTVDYRSYTPKIDTTLYSYDGTDLYTAKYSNYTGLGLYLNAVYDLQISDQFKIYGGLLGGVMLTRYKLTLTDDNGETGSVSSSESITYLGPKLGFHCLVSDRIGVGLEGRYTLGVVGANYNTREGGSTTKGHGTYAGNLFLTYSF
jgi:hypothetical protein